MLALALEAQPLRWKCKNETLRETVASTQHMIQPGTAKRTVGSHSWPNRIRSVLLDVYPQCSLLSMELCAQCGKPAGLEEHRAFKMMDEGS